MSRSQASAAGGVAVIRGAAADRLKRVAAMTAVGVAAVLIVAKAGAYFATGSVALLSTLIDSLLDLAASAVNLFAIRHATQPADRDHRFGHGKAEPLAGLAQAAFVGGSAGFLIFEVIARLIEPRPIAQSGFGLAVMGFAICLTLALVVFQKYVVRKTGSLAISADSLHYSADVLTNISVVVALLLSANLGWTLADPLIALGIAAYLLFGAWQIMMKSLNVLMDRELPEAERAQIRQIATAHPAVIGLHDLRTRSSGTRVFIQFHLEMNADLTLIDAHTIADQVMAEIQRAFPGAEVLIHEDPYGVPEHREVFR